MSIAEDHNPAIVAAAGAPKPRRRRLFTILLAAATAQYTIVALVVGASVAVALHHLVTPHVVSQFEAIAAALKH
jgi:hypothetical protein